MVPLQCTGGRVCPVSAYITCTRFSIDIKGAAGFYVWHRWKMCGTITHFSGQNTKAFPCCNWRITRIIRWLFAGRRRRSGTTLAFALGVHASYVMVMRDWALLGYTDAQTDFLQWLPQFMAQSANTWVAIWVLVLQSSVFEHDFGVHAYYIMHYCTFQPVGGLRHRVPNCNEDM